MHSLQAQGVPILSSYPATFWRIASRSSQRRRLAPRPIPEQSETLTAKTALYVADALRTALPGRPILIALGNNDSECGDYQLEPGGAFLASLRDTVRDLAGPDRLAQDFDQTLQAGGYYAMRHPTLADVTILVVNDVLWSTRLPGRLWHRWRSDSRGDDGLA